MVKPTQEQVIAWAREAGYLPDSFGFGAWDMKEFNEAMTLAYEAGRKDENEVCAKLCADLWCELPEPRDARDCYDAIRARREQ